MKKFISIMLTAIILSLSFLCVGASAAETKTETLIADLAETKSIKIDFADDAFANEIIKISNVEVAAKIVENDGVEDVKVAASAKVWFFKVKLLITEGKIYAYIPLLLSRIDITEILGEDVELLEPAKELMAFIESDFLEYLVLAASGEKEIEPYGKVYTEEFKVDMEAIIKKLVEDGEIENPEDIDISDMTLLIAVKGYDAYGFIVLSRRKDFLQYFYYFLCFLGVPSVYPLSFNLVSFDRSVVLISRCVGSNAELG